MINPVSETVIVAALRKGNIERAVELILDVYQDEVFAYFARLVGTADAVTMYHELMAVASEQLSAFDGQSSVRAWLYSAARNFVIGHHRRYRFEGALEAAYVPIGDSSGSVGLQLEDQELHDALAELDPKTIEIIQLSLWHRLFLGEVAHVVERPELEVRKLAVAGLQLLAARLKRRGGHPS